MQQDFKASNYMVQTSEKLMAEKAVLSSPNIKPGKVLPSATDKMVKQLYVLIKSKNHARDKRLCMS
jgi:hypothetical protein